MKPAITGDSAGEGLATIPAEHFNNKYDASEISRLPEGADPFYANMADRVAAAVARGDYDRAIMICGTGIGVAMSANKVPGIRAAQCADTYSSEHAALSNNAQIITMGARTIGNELAKTIAEAFLDNTFDFDAKGRSAENVQAVDAVDAKYRRS